MQLFSPNVYYAYCWGEDNNTAWGYYAYVNETPFGYAIVLNREGTTPEAGTIIYRNSLEESKRIAEEFLHNPGAFQLEDIGGN